MTRRLKNRIIICINIFLIIALTFSIFTIIRKTDDLSAAQKEIEHKTTAIEKLNENKKDLESKLEKTESALENAKTDKKKLESENEKLKKQITELKNKKDNASSSKKPTSTVTKKPVAQNPKPSGKICYLTFDDGPTENTLKILKILDKYDVKATFFVINNAQTKIEYVKQIHAAGHTVGLHSNSHNYAQIYKSTSAYFTDLKKISNAVKKYTGEDSKVMRFPGGGSNMVSAQYKKGIMSTLTHQVTDKGYTYFDWNVDSGDASAATVSSTKIINNVLNGARGKSSVCVLMHDAKAKTTTVDALPKIIEGLKKQGFTFKPLTKDCYGYHHGVNN